MDEMNIYQQLADAEKQYEDAKILEAAALERVEKAETKLARAEKNYKCAQVWLESIEESNRKIEENKETEYAKAVEAAEWRRKQNEAEREEEHKWNNMTSQEREAVKEECHRGVEEIKARWERELLERLGSPEAVAAYKKKQQEEIEVLRAEREERLKREKAEHEAYLRRIGVKK